MLVSCLCLLLSATYAWLTMSLAPEVTGINTHIGANGNLEIALLNDKTYIDPSLINTLIGSSMEISDPIASNGTWGNLIDLSSEEYGLQKITLQPSRLNVRPNIDGTNSIGSSILSYPEYDTDGRFVNMNSDTVTTVFSDGKFIYNTNNQKYGVRCVGRASAVSPQKAALTNSKTAIRSYRTSAVRSVESAVRSNFSELLALYLDALSNTQKLYSSQDVALIQDTATRLLGAVSYLDLALRQAIIGYSAISISDPDLFNQLHDTLGNSMIPLSQILDYIPGNLPENFRQMVVMVDDEKSTLQQVIYACNKMTVNKYSSEVILSLLNVIIPSNEVFINDIKLSNSSEKSLTEDTLMTVTSNAASMALIADYSGNYNVFFDYSPDISIELVTLSTKSPGYLEIIAKTLDDLEIDDGENSDLAYEINDLFGYVVDLAFRCNNECNLLLQTAPNVRVEGSTSEIAAEGQGSYMRFSSEQLNQDQILSMMDAFRIGFINDHNDLLCIAKLNVSNYYVDGLDVKAPLYLYDFKVSIDGSISIGERLTEDRMITELTKNTVSVLSIIVWLDGDHVDNSLAATSLNSLTGALNLQFSTDASLKPADIPVNSN